MEKTIRQYCLQLLTKVTRQTGGGRGVYSFCMCPGGWVVNASSEEGHLAVNGMSYQARDSRNANSAMIVTVTPDDFPGTDVLAGVEFQRKLEKAAYGLCDGKVPVQLFGDFCRNVPSTMLGDVEPCIKGQYELSNVRTIFPQELSSALEEGIKGCEALIHGFFQIRCGVIRCGEPDFFSGSHYKKYRV